MLKISKLTDYGLLAAVYLTRRCGAVVVGRVKLPVVSVFVAVAIGGRTSPGALIVDVALVVCPS